MSEKILKPEFESLGRPLYKGERLTPFFFDESATFPELIYMLNDYINQLTERVNSYDEFATEVMKLLENVDKQIADTTLEKLTEWYNDGSLQNMLQAVSTEFFENLSEELQAQYLELKNDVNSQLLDWNSLPKYTTLQGVRILRDIHEWRYSKATDSFQYCIARQQGGVVFDRAGTRNYMGCNNCAVNWAEVKNKTIINGYSNIQDIGTRIVGATPFELGHCNGMTYNSNDDKLYIAPSTWVNAQNQTEYKLSIFRVNMQLTTVEETHIPFHTTDIAFYNGNLYIVDDSTNPNIFTMYKMTFVTNGDAVLEKVISYDRPTSQPVYQFDIADGKIFYTNSDNRQIHVLDLTDGSYLWTYNIPLFDVTGHFRIKEIESISVFENGDIYLTAASYDGLATTAQCTRTDFFVFNYKTNKLSYDWEDPVFTEYGGSEILVTQSYKTPNVFSSELNCVVSNPNGSASRPFETLAEAVQFVNDNPNITHCFISLTTDHRLYTGISCNKMLYIRSKGATSSDTSTWHYTGGFLIEGCPNLTLSFINNYSSCGEKNHGKYTGIYAVYSTVNMAYAITHRSDTAVMYATDTNFCAESAIIQYQKSTCQIVLSENPQAGEKDGGKISISPENRVRNLTDNGV